MKQNLHFILILLSFGQLFSQTSANEQKVKTAIEDYFQLEREKIHVQFNKSKYVSDEKIAFKGYIFSSKKNLPNLETTNIQLAVYDADGKVVQKQLLKGSNGAFDGIIELNDAIVSGSYRFQFYTNWMNNFHEDESYIQTIEIINKKETYELSSSIPDYKTANITVFPESGTFLKDITNTIGIQIKDCNQRGIHVPKGFVLDAKGNTVASFFTNKMGYGRFYLNPTANETYTIQIANDKLNLTQPLPLAQNSGLVISPNNNLPDNRLAVTIHTNNEGLNLYKNKNYTLAVHQNGNSLVKSFNFSDKNTSQIIYFDENVLSAGTNTIRLIDENNVQIAERLVYIYKGIKVTPALDAQQASNDTIRLSGKLEAQYANLSISILPEETLCLEQNNSLLGTYYLNAFLDKPERNTASYFDKTNNFRANDIELLLLNKRTSKYQWSSIITDKPKALFPSAKGVTISGSVLKALDPKTKYKVLLVSLKDKMFAETTLDQNNNFKFENYFAQDSTSYAVQLLDQNNKPVETKMITNILYGNVGFNKTSHADYVDCIPMKVDDNVFVFKNANDINALKAVEIKNEYKKTIYNHQKEGNNRQAKAYKINKNEFGTVLAFLGNHGFIVGTNNDFSIFIKNRRSSKQENDQESTPVIYIDDFPLFDFNTLADISVDRVDEIYIDLSDNSSLAAVGYGVVKIYMRKDGFTNYVKEKPTLLLVKSGFAQNKTYTATEYLESKESNAFGTLQWAPNLLLDPNNRFYTSFSGKTLKEITVQIEGFTLEGHLVSETRKIAVKPKS